MHILLGTEISDNGYAAVEKEESEIIGNSKVIFWMIGIIGRFTKNIKAFFRLNNRTKENLFQVVDNNFNIDLSEPMEIDDDEENESYALNTKVFSDSWPTYRINDFKEKEYILKRVNHSVWISYWLFHTKIIEGL